MRLSEAHRELEVAIESIDREGQGPSNPPLVVALKNVLWRLDWLERQLEGSTARIRSLELDLERGRA